MLENHSFDNYFGALAYVPGGPYHPSSVGCPADDHRCVDGLNCRVDAARGLVCTNSNLDDEGLTVAAFHATSLCTVPDLAHSWTQSHLEVQLPQVSWLDPSSEDSEHPPYDIQRGQAFVSTVVNAIRGGPYWKDSVLFITYDEHGGFYDHVVPPPAPEGGARTPDGLFPGQCADLSNPPASQQPGAGVHCSDSASEARSLCPALARSPASQYPDSCASFDQLGFRVPFIIVSPFAKPHYVGPAS